jgi:hypothetical protein
MAKKGYIMSEITQQQLDEKFFERADAHISLANEHITQKIQPGLVNNSLLYAAARFSAWLAAAGFQSGEEMITKKKELMDYFIGQYSSMLEENLENYAENYDLYMGISKEQTKET